jgi:hypothetical protein
MAETLRNCPSIRTKREALEAMRNGMSSHVAAGVFSVCQTTAAKWARDAGLREKERRAYEEMEAAIVARVRVGGRTIDIARELRVSRWRVARVRAEMAEGRAVTHG